MFLRDGRNDECGMEVHESLSQGGELRVPSPDFQILHMLVESIGALLAAASHTPVRIVYTIKLPPPSWFFPASVMRIGISGFS